MTDLINNLPDILLYVIHGYIFISVYNWISFKDSSDYKYVFIKSIAASYIIKIVYDYYVQDYFRNDIFRYTITLIFVSALLGAVLGKLISNNFTNKLLNILHIGRTTNKNIWDDVIKPRTWIRLYLKDKNITYLGQYRYGEEFQREPIIVLATYQILDINGKVITDYSHDKNELVMLNTKDFERIEIIYTPEKESLLKKIIAKIKSIFMKCKK